MTKRSHIIMSVSVFELLLMLFGFLGYLPMSYLAIVMAIISLLYYMFIYSSILRGAKKKSLYAFTHGYFIIMCILFCYSRSFVDVFIFAINLIMLVTSAIDVYADNKKGDGEEDES